MNTQDQDQPKEQTRQERLEALNDLLINHFLNVLREDKPIRPSMLNTARQFLRDQGISFESLREKEDVEQQQQAFLEEMNLPFLNEDMPGGMDQYE